MTIAAISNFEGSKPTTKVFGVSNLSDGQATSLYASGEGVGKAYIKAILKKEQELNCIEVAFGRGDERKTRFTLFAKKGDGKWTKCEPCTFVTSGTRVNSEEFNFKPIKTEELKLVFQGNLDNICLDPKTKKVTDAYKINNRSAVLAAHADSGNNKQILSVRTFSVWFKERTEDEEKAVKQSIEKEKKAIKRSNSTNAKAEEECKCCDSNSKECITGASEECRCPCCCGDVCATKEFPFHYIDVHKKWEYVDVAQDQQQQCSEEESKSNIEVASSIKKEEKKTTEIKEVKDNDTDESIEQTFNKFLSEDHKDSPLILEGGGGGDHRFDDWSGNNDPDSSNTKPLTKSEGRDIDKLPSASPPSISDSTDKKKSSFKKK